MNRDPHEKETTGRASPWFFAAIGLGVFVMMAIATVTVYFLMRSPREVSSSESITEEQNQGQEEPREVSSSESITEEQNQGQEEPREVSPSESITEEQILGQEEPLQLQPAPLNTMESIQQVITFYDNWLDGVSSVTMEDVHEAHQHLTLDLDSATDVAQGNRMKFRQM